MGILKISFILLTLLACNCQAERIWNRHLCSSGKQYWDEINEICVCYTTDMEVLKVHYYKEDCINERIIGESCDSELNICVPSATCSDGVCVCEEPVTWDEEKSLCYNQKFCETRNQGRFMYNEEVGKCLLAIGSKVWGNKIEFNYACPNNSKIQNVRNERPDLFHCECNPGLTPAEDDSYTCLVAKYKDDICSPDSNSGSRCDQNSNLQCLRESSDAGHVCSCVAEAGMIWSPMALKCVIRANDGECNPIALEPNCTPGSSCIGYCICDSYAGYIASNDGFCYKRHGYPCQGLGDCHPNLSCIDGSCSCPEPIFQKYDENIEVQRCRTLAGFSCTSTTTSLCTKHADCQNGVCECESGFRNNLNGVCVEALPYGSNCTKGPCDSALGMACIDGICACISTSLKYDERKGCVATSGATCGIIGPFDGCTDKCGEYVVQCEDSTECKPITNEFTLRSERNQTILRRCIPM